MADPLGNVEKIVKVAVMIKEAVDKVRKNKEECHEIRKRVVRVSALLTRLQETEMMDPATGSTLESDMMKSEKINGPAGNKSIPSPCLTKFMLSELEAATNHFSKKNIIGEGASAVIYKGVLHDGLVVAVKRFRDSVGFSESHFYDEFNLLPKLHHKCVAHLVGYCHEVTVSLEWSGGRFVGVQERHCLFVEEYMPNGSLETIINVLQCQWSTCIQIIQGIADGLYYLHEQCIVHSDLKPSNILLDHNMNPKISDFGIARVLDHGDDLFTIDVNYLAGTMGYMPPEYIVEGTLSTKYDVYSFGVILLEIIGSMCEHKNFRRQASVEWASEVRSAEFGSEFFSQSLYHVTELKQIRRCIEVGLLCTQLKPTERPTMADVIEMLNDRRELQNPKKPRYTKKIALPVPDINRPKISTSCPARYL